ncbi:MAG: LysR family transcriptional regulator [Gaiellaceae bacterium]
MLDLKLVATLQEVAARGSFSAAARDLHFTQPAVSRQVAQLERAIGTPLLVRSRRGVTLTPAGRLVVEHAETVRAQLVGLEEELTRLVAGEQVDVTIGAFPSAFIGLVPEIVRRLRERSPGAQIDLRRCGHEEAVTLVRRADLDLALVFARPEYRRQPSGVRIADLGDEPMLVLLPRGHPLAGLEEVSLLDLRDEQWIVGAPDPTSSIIVTACHRAGFEPSIAFDTDDALATQSLVAAGLGVSLSSPWLAQALRDDVVMRPLAEPRPRRRIQAVLPDPPRPSSALLLEVASEVAALEPAS